MCVSVSFGVIVFIVEKYELSLCSVKFVLYLFFFIRIFSIFSLLTHLLYFWLQFTVLILKYSQFVREKDFHLVLD